MSTKLILVIIIVLSLAGLGGFGYFYFQDQFKSPIAPGTISLTNLKQTPSSTETVPYKLEEVASDLYVPWSIIFSSSDRIIVSERSGNIKAISNNQTTNLIEIDEVSERSESGLMGLTLDPNYEQNKLIYACYAYEDNGQFSNRVISLRDNQTNLEVVDTLIEALPSAIFHAGCRLGIGPDQKLYITTGDARTPSSAQDVESLAGKILRLNLDGSIPSDNPFPNSPVYSLGHRNPQGITWHPESNEMYSTEHGPSGNDGPPGGDEVNLISAGENYGWPEVSHSETDSKFISPISVFTPAEAPASALIYSGKVFPQFKNRLFFGALRGQGIVVLTLSESDPTKVEQIEKLDISLGRIRDVVESPDGYIYFSTSNTDGRGDPRDNDDKIYRLIPAN